MSHPAFRAEARRFCAWRDAMRGVTWDVALDLEPPDKPHILDERRERTDAQLRADEKLSEFWQRMIADERISRRTQMFTVKP